MTLSPLHHYPANAHGPFLVRPGAAGLRRGVEWSSPPASSFSARPHAQQSPALRPRIKGRAYRLKVDSSPQQATVYWDAGVTPTPKNFGMAGYTPITIKVPKGPVKVIVELAGFKPQEQTHRRAQEPGADVHAGARAGDGAPRPAGQRRRRRGRRRGLHRRRRPRNGAQHLRAAGRPPPGRGAQAGLQAVLRLVRSGGGGAPHARHHAGARRGAVGDAAGDLRRGRRRLPRRRAQGRGARDHPGRARPATTSIEVRKEGIPPWRQTVTVVAGQQVEGGGHLRRRRQRQRQPARHLQRARRRGLRRRRGQGEGAGHDQRHQAGRAHRRARARRGSSRRSRRVRVASNENAIVSFRMEVAPPDRPHAGAQGAVDHPQRRGLPRRLEPGARAGRPQRSRSRQALRLGAPRRLHRLQARDRPGREPAGDAGGRPVGHAARCASSRRPRGPRCASTASSIGRTPVAHDAVPPAITSSSSASRATSTTRRR